MSLVLNAGSSSIKFQLFEAGGADEPRRIFRGLFEGLGSSPHFTVRNQTGEIAGGMRWDETEPFGHEEALAHLAAWIRENRGDYRLEAVGHRVVHGGVSFSAPVLIDQAVLRELEQLVPLAPLHQPHNLTPIRILRAEVSRPASGRVLRHRVSPQPARPRAAVRPAALDDRSGRAALRLSWPLLRLHRVRSRALRPRPCLGTGRGCSSRQRRQPVRAQQWRKHRHDHGLLGA